MATAPHSNRTEPSGPIVAELGRPETPEETAARKAETSRRHRSNQTTLNLVAALIVCLGVVLITVLVVVRPDPAPREPVDFAAIAAAAQPTVDATLIAPELADGWSSNSARLERTAGVTSWYIGLITPDEQFVALRQGIDADDTWLAVQLGSARATGAITVGGVAWDLYDNRNARGDTGNLAYAMTTVRSDSTIVLYGTAADSEFETLAASVAAQLQEGGR